jgi:hypothetical protein
MENEERVVARFKASKVMKGYLRSFSDEAGSVIVEDTKSRAAHSIPVEDLKAVFFVKSFEGSSQYRERKIYGIRENIGRKVYLKFHDGESLVGFLEEKVPPEKIFNLTRPDPNTKGFYMVPVDADCNNKRVFAVWDSIEDMTTFP